MTAAYASKTSYIFSETFWKKIMKDDWMLKKNTGVISILAGIGLLLISFLFSSGYRPGWGVIGSFDHMEIVFVERKHVDTLDYTYYRYANSGSTPSQNDGRFAIPLKYPVALSIVFVLFGIGVVALSKNGDNK